MTILNNITIKNRLLIAYLLLFVSFIAFAFFAVSEIGKVGGLTRSMYDHPLQVSNAALQARVEIVKMHRSEKDVLLAKTERELSDAIRRIEFEEQLVYENLNIVRDNILGEQGQQLERDTRALFKDWKTIRNEVINLVSKGNTKAASVITRNKEAEHVLYLERHMNDLVSYARNKAGGFLENTDSIQEGVMLNVSIFICVVILLFVVSGYLLLTGIMTNIESLNTTMSKITETGILIKSDMTGTHEIAVLSHHFNKLVEKLLDQIWLRDCQNDLNRELSGGHSYDDLLRLSVKYVSERVDACAGALFTQNEDRSLFELKSSYALAAGKQFASAFKPGEGIVGQVAVGERPILLKNVTREEALIKTATVSEPPKNIYALPLRFKNNMLGVLEVASFQEINTVKKEFLDSAADIIATSMFATSQNNIIKTLLDASHEDNLKLLAQAKEMRAQAEELRAQAQELEEINEEFRQQSEELQTQNVELEVQSQRVEEANRLKSEFLSNMSHELRTPLNSVLALSRLLISQASNVLSADQAKYLEVIERNGKNLLALINNILDLSRIEAGKLDIFPNLFSLVSLMETLVESLSPLAEEKNIKLHLTIPAELPWIESDESRVYQICQNLIGNAIKFTSRGHVKVSVFDDGQKVYINVKDTGIGISQKDLPIIFDEFRQVDGSSSRHYEGTGLGLAIARKAARILGGDITVESVLDQGSTFSLVFPIHWREKLIAKKSELISAPSDINGNERKETTTVVNDDPLSSSKPHKSARKIDYKNNSPRILLVEDNESAVIQVMSALKNEGYTLDVARNGQEALNYIKQSIPDGIIMDLMMPEIDGFEVLESMRGISKTANIPVLILTAKDLTKEDLKQLTSNNIQQLIQKGDVDRDELLRKTRMMLGIEPNIKAMPTHSTASKATQPRKAKPTVLIIEDNPDNMITIKAVLGDRYHLLEATDGMTGLKTALEELPTLILLDMSLPSMDGLTVIKKIRENTRSSEIPVIAMTARAMRGDEKSIIAAGCSDYISKPIDQDIVIKKIEQWLSKG